MGVLGDLWGVFFLSDATGEGPVLARCRLDRSAVGVERSFKVTWVSFLGDFFAELAGDFDFLRSESPVSSRGVVLNPLLAT